MSDSNPIRPIPPNQEPNFTPSDWIRPIPPDKQVHFSPLRRIQQARDSDGNVYDILVQTQEMSCGLASSVMLMALYGRICWIDDVDKERHYKQIAARFPGSLVESDKLWAKGKEYGSTADNIEQLLKSQRVTIALKEARWLSQSETIPVLQISRLRSPAMVLWGWYSGGRRHGGHFTVAARATKNGAVVILDPWDGSLAEVMPGHPYNGNGYLDCVLYTR